MGKDNAAAGGVVKRTHLLGWKSPTCSDEERKKIRESFPKPYRDFITSGILHERR
jgi:hypothetical protein